MNKVQWININKEIKRRLKDHSYTYLEAITAIGCGEKTLRRYMESRLIEPFKRSDNWYFSSNDIAKCKFIVQATSSKILTASAAAGIYDYIQEHKCACDFDKLRQYIEQYW